MKAEEMAHEELRIQADALSKRANKSEDEIDDLNRLTATHVKKLSVHDTELAELSESIMLSSRRVQNQVQSIDFKVEAATKDLQEKLLKMSENIEKTTKELVKRSEITNINNRFNEMVNKTEFAKLGRKIDPIVEEIEQSQNGFRKEQQQMAEMIRRFDELLLEKTNKVSLIELEHRISENYLHKK